MRSFKKIIAALLTLAVLLPVISVSAETVTASGTCGTQITWSLSDAGVLTLTGSGEMPSYTSTSKAPWSSYASSITKAVFGSGITTTGNYSLSGCTALTQVEFPASGMNTISVRTFNGCAKLSSIAIPYGVTSLGNYAFYNCSTMKTVSIPSTVTNLGSNTFYGCIALNGVTLPSNLTRIEGSLFNGCKALTSMKIPETVTYIGTSVFSGCEKLVSVTLPSGITSIPDNTFKNCKAITEISIPGNVNTIGTNAFYYCSKLEKINIPSGVTSIGTYAFYYCKLLTDIIIPSGVTLLNANVFKNCTGLTKMDIPAGVTTINANAFDNCTNLASLHFYGACPSINTSNAILSNTNLTVFYEASAADRENFASVFATENIYNSDYVTNIGINLPYVSLKTGETHTILTNLSSVGSTGNSALTFVSKNPEIAAIDKNGNVTGVSAGITIITATTVLGGYTSKCAVHVYGGSADNVLSQTSAEKHSYEASTANNNSYGKWAWTVKTLLTENSDGSWDKLQATDETVYIDTYSADFTYISSRAIANELSIYGGAYANDTNYYLVFGEENDAQDNTKEVMRIVKYDRQLNRIGAASIYGSIVFGNMPGITIPFNAGSLRFAERENELIIHTARTMYTWTDGLRHQSDLILSVNTEAMTVRTINDNAYASHSFNQFVQYDGEVTAYVSHGDSRPRAITLYIDTGALNLKRTNVFPIGGTNGQNITGVSIGGFEISKSSYIVAGSSVFRSVDEWDLSTAFSAARDIFVTITPKNFTSDADTKTVWLNDVPYFDGCYSRTPHLVKITDELYIVCYELWSSGFDYLETRFVAIDDKGNILNNYTASNARLSDCVPQYHNGRLVWFTVTSTNLMFYSVNPLAASILPYTANSYVIEPETKYVLSVPEGESIESFAKGFSRGTVSLFDSAGNALTEGIISTGVKARINSEEYIAIVTGDTDGDGIISNTDYLRIKAHFKGNITLENEYAAAADVNNDGKMGANDYLLIKRRYQNK